VKLLSDYLSVSDHNPTMLQTDGWTDRQTTYNSNIALRITYVLRAVKS